MKKKSLLLFALLPLCLTGCKDDEPENPVKPIDYEKIADFGSAYKCEAEMIATGNLGEGLPSAIQTTKLTYELNGDIAYTKHSLEGKMTGTLEETAKYLSDRFEQEVPVDQIETFLDLAKQYNQIKEYKIEGNTVTAEMNSGTSETYYDYSAHDVLPVAWMLDLDETSSTYEKWVGRSTFYEYYEFDLSDYTKHAKEYTVDRENNVLSITDAKAKELKLIDEDMFIDKFNMYLDSNDRISKIEQIIRQDDVTQEITYIIESGSTLALPAADKRAPLCTHDKVNTAFYSPTEYQGEHYHANYCYDCGSYVNVQKCDFNEEGFCKVCGHELTTDIKLAGPEGYEPMIFLIVNSVTNKIKSINFNPYCFSLDGNDAFKTDYSYKYFDKLVCDAITSEAHIYGSLVQINYNNVSYVFMDGRSLSDETRVYYLLTNCTITQDDVPGDYGTEVQFTLTYDSMAKYVVGSVYTPGN